MPDLLIGISTLLLIVASASALWIGWDAVATRSTRGQ